MMNTLQDVALYRAQLKAKWKAKRLGRLLRLVESCPGGASEVELDDAQYAMDDALAEVRAAEIDLEGKKVSSS